VKSEKKGYYMSMPGWPGAMFMFIMIHPQLVFALLKALINEPSHHGGFEHLGERHIDRGVGKGEFHLSIRSASDKEPYEGVLGKSVSGKIDPEAS
jgi:hypothetical protein